MKLALLLITLAVGYKVLVEGLREKKGAIRLIGLAVGTFIIAVSLMGSLCVLMNCAGKKGCSLMNKSECSIKAAQK